MSRRSKRLVAETNINEKSQTQRRKKQSNEEIFEESAVATSTASVAVAKTVVRVGVGCLVTTQNNPGCVLFGERMGSHGAGKMALPGGHLELGESWAECAIRETKEETNLDIKNLKLFHVTNDPAIGGDHKKHYITIFMTGEVSDESSELQNLEPHKCKDWNWVPWSDIVKLRDSNEEKLFDPMIHMIDGLSSNEKESPSFFAQ